MRSPVLHSWIFPDLILRSEPQDIAEPFRSFTKWEPMGTVAMNDEPAPDEKVQHKEQNEVNGDCKLNSFTVVFKIQAIFS